MEMISSFELVSAVIYPTSRLMETFSKQKLVSKKCSRKTNIWLQVVYLQTYFIYLPMKVTS